MKIHYCILLSILATQCTRVPEGKVGINIRKSKENIEEQIERYTPLGSTVEQVLNFVNTDLHYEIKHEDKRFPRHPIVYEEYYKINGEPRWSVTQKPAGLIFTVIGFTWSKSTLCTWYFDKNNILIKIHIRRSGGVI